MKILKYKVNDKWETLYESYKESEVSEPEYVDLGLPSGTLWATCNLGASSPEDIGLFFQWGNTKGYSLTEATKLNSSNNECSIEEKYNYDDNLTILQSEDDAAYVLKGNEWRIPTKEQFQELLDNTKITYEGETSKFKDGDYKAIFTSNINSNKLVIPFIPYNNYFSNQQQYNDCIFLWCSNLSSSQGPMFSYIYRNDSGVANSISDRSNESLRDSPNNIRPVKSKS